MSVWKLCLRSIWGKKKRSLLLALVVFVISIFIYAGWSCKYASIQTQDKSRQAIGASFRLEENEANRHIRLEEQAEKVGTGKEGTAGGYHQKQLASGDWMTWVDNSFETLIFEDIEKIAAVEGIGDYNIVTANTVVNPVDFERIEDEDVDQSKDQLGVSLRGELSMILDFDVQRNNLIIVAGRMIEPKDENVCVISEELALQDGLQVGDKLSFNNWKERDTSTIYMAEIIGIYESPNGITALMAGDSYRSENIIYTDLDFPEKVEGEIGNPLYQYAVFIVENVDEYNIVKEKIKSLDIGWERYDLLDNLGMSDTVAENYSVLKEMSILILILVFISGVIIVCLIFLFWIKGRVHEIGIFLSLGRTKENIIMQILMEGILIGAVAFTLATVTSGIVANKIAEYLINYQVTVESEQREADKGLIANSVGDDETEITGINVSIDSSMIWLSGISVVGIIAVSISLTGIMIIVQKPKDILTKMS